MPAVLLILRLLTGIGSLFRLAASGFRWFRKRGRRVGPVLRPRFDWELDGQRPSLRFRIKNDGVRSAIIDDLQFSIRGKGDAAPRPMAFPEGFDEAYPIQVRPDESSDWYELPLTPAHVEIVRERERLARLRGRDEAATGDDTAEPAEPRHLASGVELDIVHEHGTEHVAVPGPWQQDARRPPAAFVDDDEVATELEAATTVLDDEADDSDFGHA